MKARILRCLILCLVGYVLGATAGLFIDLSIQDDLKNFIARCTATIVFTQVWLYLCQLGVFEYGDNEL